MGSYEGCVCVSRLKKVPSYGYYSELLQSGLKSKKVQLRDAVVFDSVAKINIFWSFFPNKATPKKEENKKKSKNVDFSLFHASTY